MITTVQIRLIADTREEALAAIAELRQAVGSARISIGSPRQGRDKAGDGNPPWLAYGTFQYDAGGASPAPAGKPRATKLKGATGRTTKMGRAATGKTTKLTQPHERNVRTPDDIGARGVFLGYDATAQRYYAQGIVGPLAGRISDPLRLKSEAAAVARNWIARMAQGRLLPPPWQEGDWRPATQATNTKTRKLRKA